MKSLTLTASVMALVLGMVGGLVQAQEITVSSYAYGGAPAIQPQGSGSLADAEDGGTELINGVIVTGWTDANNVGFRNDSDDGNPQPRVTFDLGGDYVVTNVVVWSITAFGNVDESVSISSSTDGVSFSAPVVVNPIVWSAGSGSGDTYVSVDVTSLPAGRYYQVDIFDPNQWMMICEVDFFGTAAPVAIAASSYTYGAAPAIQPQSSGALADSENGGTELINGVIVAAWNDVNNVGFRNDSENNEPQPQVTFDLGGNYNVATVELFTPGFENVDDQVKIYSSTDGVTFSAPVVLNPIVWVSAAPDPGKKVSVNVSALPAGGFIRVEQFDNGTQWMMLSEVKFTGNAAGGESDPPVPDPMVFEVAPASFHATAVIMTATTAVDAASSPVEYLFTNTVNNVIRDWGTSRVWTNTGLTTGVSYGYQVKARDAVGNETGWSGVANATPAPETTPPLPDPMTFEVAPDSLNATSIVMTATTAIDAASSPVAYFFTNTINGATSGWGATRVWTDSGLTTGVTYGYRVKARDAVSNETAWSSVANAVPVELPLLSVDFGSGAAPVESGFEKQSSGSDTHSTDDGDLTVTVNGAAYDRGASGGGNNDLYRDFYYNNSGGQTLTLSGPAISASTTYELTFFSSDSGENRTTSFGPASGTTGPTLGPLDAAAGNPTGLNDPAFSATGEYISDGSGNLTFTLSSGRTCVNGFTIDVVPPDITAPDPDPMVFEVAPAAFNATAVIMTATTAVDAASSPVAYLFTNTVNGVVQDWSTSRVWTNTGLTTGVSYGYQVKARDAVGNETGWSTPVANATPTQETTPPSPSPMVFEVLPASLNATSIVMTATTAVDIVSSPVEYLFTNTVSHEIRDWGTSRVWTNTGLTTGVSYGYRVMARDAVSNETAWSAVANAIPSAVPAEIAVSSYVYEANPPNNGNFLDEGTDFTDGYIPTDSNPFNDLNYVGFNGIDPQILFDLGGLHDVQTIVLASTTAYTGEPESLNISISVDGVLYSTPVNIVPSFTPASGVVSATLDVSALASARYFRLDVQGSSWTFLSEIDFIGVAAGADIDPPTPDPMTFAIVPAAIDPTTIAMTAATALDLASPPVAYFFTNTVNGDVRNWSASTVWTNTGLSTGVSYGYQVKARDAVSNETAWSAVASATPDQETTPPLPDPMVFEVPPASLNATSVVMTATTAVDAASSPVSYFFTNTVNGDVSGWIPGRVWTNTPLLPGTNYGFQVKARDALSNETAFSSIATARPEIPVASYVYEANAPNSGWADTGGIELTDGWRQTSGGYDQPGNVGFSSIEPQIAFDLGAVYDVSIVEVTYWASATWRPTNEVVSVSIDGSTYSAPTDYTLTATALTTAVLDVSALPAARYYRITFKRDDQWMFFSEVDFFGAAAGADTDPPEPDPMTFAVVPIGIGPTTIDMTASTAFDLASSPVQYFFTNTINGDVRGWDASTVWTNTGLTTGNTYGYQVKARDALSNETAWSSVANAQAGDETVPPNPDPMTFEVAPALYNIDSVVMTATTAVDVTTPPVEYIFTNTLNGDVSGWMSTRVWTNSGLTDGVSYGYRVKARDAISNETAWSAISSAAPGQESDPPLPDPMTFAVTPNSAGDGVIDMTATTATDAVNPPVQYFFTNTVNGTVSGWGASTVWTNTGLTLGDTYGYQVKARDAVSNETAWSAVASTRLDIAVVSYVYEVGTPHANWPDTGGIELTDGKLPPNGATYDYLENVGFSHTNPQIAFDFGAAYVVATIDVTYWANANWRWTNAAVSVSSDGISYTAPTSLPLSSTAYTTDTLDVSALPDARYFRITFARNGGTQWAWLSEVDFYGVFASRTVFLFK